MNSNFGDFLKQKRQELKLTQKELANKLFVSESAVSKWEKNIAHPDITLLPKLSEILMVSEHELITASIDNETRNERIQAKKWRTLSTAWSMFFYISYGVALLTCFICNLAINKTLSWFWIVFSALLLSFSFTNLPKYINKYKLLFIPLSIYLALCLLLGVCAIYSNGNWFWIASLSVLLGLVIIFLPIYISNYSVFNKIKNYNEFISVGIDFLLLNILLLVINNYSITYGFSNNWWYFSIALPIVSIVYLVLNLFLCVRFLKVNKFIKTSIILSLTDIFLYIVPLFINVRNPEAQKEINQLNIFKANFSMWQTNLYLENNIHCIVFLSILMTASIFLGLGLIKLFRIKNKQNI
jgi:transcriptional regulator with XRE-family HTH domain